MSIPNEDLEIRTERNQLIADLMSKIHSYLDEQDKNGLYCPAPSVKNLSRDYTLPLVSLDEETTNLVRLSLDFSDIAIDNDNTEIQTIAQEIPLTIHKDSITRYLHEATFWCFGKLDSKLSKLASVNDGCDALTPDIIDIRTTTAVVIELTTLSPSLIRHNYLVDAYDRKREKYFHAIRRRSGNRKVFYGIIVVCENGILTNCEMGNLTLWDSLIYAFKVSRIIRDIARNALGDNPDNDDYNSLAFKFRSLFPSLNPHISRKNRVFNSQLYDRFSKVANGTYKVNKTLVQCFDKMALQEGLRELALCAPMVSDDVARRRAYSLCSYAILSHTNKPPQDHRGLRSDKKTLIVLPFIITKFFHDDDTRNKLNLRNPGEGLGDYCGDSTFRLWQEVWHQNAAGKIRRIEESAEDVFINMTLSDDDCRYHQEFYKQFRKDYHRVRVDLTESEWAALSIHGIKGKKYKFLGDNIEHKNKSKYRFSPSTPVDDIQAFLNDSWSYLFQERNDCVFEDKVERLITHSYNAYNNFSVDNSEVRSLLRREDFLYFNKNLCFATALMSDIAHELLVSRKQNCNNNEFIFKRVRRFPVYLIIRQGNSQSHTFFSIGLFNDDIISTPPTHFSTIFTKLTTNGVFSWTEFRSVVTVKLINFIKTEEMTLQFLRSWQDISEASLETKQTIFLEKPYQQHFLLNLLLFLHNKQEPCDVSTATRYIIMESFVDRPLIPRPQKMLDKLPNYPKSRLTVLLNIMIKRYMLSSIMRPPRMIENDNGRTWENILSWVTSTNMRHPRQMVNSMYSGYAIGKNRVINNDSEGLIFDSVVEHEDTYLEARMEGLGHGEISPENVKMHEFSFSLLTDCIYKYQAHLKNIMGENYKRVLTTRVLKGIMDINMEGFATLSACSKFNSDWYKLPFSDVYHREKVIVAIAKVVNKEQISDYINLMAYSLDVLIEKDTMHICVFPKDQVTGIREIYVLSIESRMCQKFVEDIGRHLCATDPCEIMMNPQNKYTLLHEHQSYVAKVFTDPLTYGISADKRRWNHGHPASKLLMTIMPFVEDILHPFLFTFLSFWEKRLILMPQNFIKAIAKHAVLDCDSNARKTYHRALIGRESNYLADCNTVGVKQQHGMMQGILHYTSSFLHTIVLFRSKGYIKAWLKSEKERGRISQECRMKITTMHSSDDSSMLISISTRNDRDKTAVKLFSAKVSMYMKHIGKYLGLYDSPKSTYHTPNLVEFNSKFTFGPSTEEPLLRHINSAVSSPVDDTILSWQETNYGLIEQSLEHGGSIWQAAHMQRNQARFHYKTLGSALNKYFSKYADILFMHNDPSLGYYMMDDPRIAGLCGTRFALYIHSRYESLETVLSSYLRDSEDGRLDQTLCLGMTKSGAFIGNTILHHGNVSKAKRAFEDAGMIKEWREEMNKNPHLMLQIATNAHQLLLKLSYKMHQSGVIKQFSQGANSLLANSSATPYIIQRLCFTNIEYNLKDPVDTIKVSKVSLYRQAKKGIIKGEQILKWVDVINNRHKLTDDDRKVIFQSSESYNRIIDTLRSFNGDWNWRYSEKRDVRKRIKLQLVSGDPIAQCGLLECCKYKWAISVNHTNQYNLDRSFAAYQKCFPWLRTTLEATVKASPFQDAVALMSFILSYKIDNRNPVISSVPIDCRSGCAALSEVIKNCFVHGLEFGPLSPTLPVIQDNYQKIAHSLYGVLALPFTNAILNTIIGIILVNNPMVEFNPVMGNNSINQIYLLQLWYSNEYAEFFQSLARMRGHIIGGWLRRQTFDRSMQAWVGPGIWQGVIFNKRIQINVNSVGRATGIISIYVESLEHMGVIHQYLDQWCKENDVMIDLKIRQPDQRSPISNGVTITRLGHIQLFTVTSLNSDLFNLNVPNICDQAIISIHNKNIYLKLAGSTILRYRIKNKDWFVGVNEVQWTKGWRSGGRCRPDTISYLVHNWLNNNEMNFDEVCSVIINNRSSFNLDAAKEFVDMLLIMAVNKSPFTWRDCWVQRVPEAVMLEDNVEPRDDEFEHQLVTMNLDDIGVEDIEPEEPVTISIHGSDLMQNISFDDFEDIQEPAELPFQSHPFVLNFLNNYRGCEGTWSEMIKQRVWASENELEYDFVTLYCRTFRLSIADYGRDVRSRRILQNLPRYSRAVEDPGFPDIEEPDVRMYDEENQ